MICKCPPDDVSKGIHYNECSALGTFSNPLPDPKPITLESINEVWEEIQKAWRSPILLPRTDIISPALFKELVDLCVIDTEGNYRPPSEWLI